MFETVIAHVFELSILIFLSLVVLLFLRFIFFSRSAPSSATQKLLGGITVFIVALLSQNALVIFSSLFIGGLIIASEEFMQNLAIILRSNSADISKNLRTSQASDAEMDQKRRSEVEQLRKTEQKSGRRRSLQKLTRDTEAVEMLVFEYFERKFGELFERNRRITGPFGVPSLVVNGVIRTPDNAIYSLVDIKYVLEKEQIAPLIQQTIKQLRPVLADHQVLLCVVAEAEIFETTETALEVFDSLKEQAVPQAGLLLFAHEDKTVRPVFGDPFVSD